MLSGGAQGQVSAAGPPLVLIVDDEALIRTTLSGVLADEAYETISAENGPEAVTMAREFRPDVILLDIWMPGWDGIETLERIKEVSPLSEVVMISGHANVSNALEASRRGAFDFIEKPLDIESILVTLRRALERRERLITRSGEQGEPQVGRVREGAPVSLPHDGQQKSAIFSHPGVLSSGLRGKNVRQRTLRQGAILYGQCLHSGQKTGLVFEPLPVNSGIHFARIGSSRGVAAFVDQVESTSFATTVRGGNTTAATIEHLMSALHAHKISNLLIKCNGEVPIFDGSANEFCRLIEEVGIEEQGGQWFEIAPRERVTYVAEPARGEREEISIEPADRLIVRYELDYPEPVGRQEYEFEFTDLDSYRREIAPARTFGFMKDIERLQKAGLAAGGRLDNFILIGSDRVINTELRFPNELVRHKVLDVIGDLFLLGRPLCARVVARMTGHSDNVEVLRKLRNAALGGRC